LEQSTELIYFDMNLRMIFSLGMGDIAGRHFAVAPRDSL
jgi:hypothetical protein